MIGHHKKTCRKTMREKKTINTTSIIGQVNNSITTDGCAVEQARAKNIPNQSLHNGTSIKQQLPLNHFFKLSLITPIY